MCISNGDFIDAIDFHWLLDYFIPYGFIELLLFEKNLKYFTCNSPNKNSNTTCEYMYNKEKIKLYDKEGVWL